jgi:hypothetical protein
MEQQRKRLNTMKLYEINQEIEKAFEECIDLETGEIKDFSKLEELTLAKNDKVREIALFIINLEGEERLIDEQLKKFLSRKKAIKNKISGLRAYLQYHTQGESYTFTEVKVYYKTSEETLMITINQCRRPLKGSIFIKKAC